MRSAPSVARRAACVWASASPVAVLVLWEFLVNARVLNVVLFSKPSAILESLGPSVQSGALLRDIRTTLAEVAVGYMAAVHPGCGYRRRNGSLAARRLRPRADRHRPVQRPHDRTVPATDHLVRDQLYVDHHPGRPVHDLSDHRQYGPRGPARRPGPDPLAVSFGASRREVLQKVVLPAAFPRSLLGSSLQSGAASPAPSLPSCSLGPPGSATRSATTPTSCR